jgi:hypothetical protein
VKLRAQPNLITATAIQRGDHYSTKYTDQSRDNSAAYSWLIVCIVYS